MRRDYARMMRAASKARGENMLDRIIDGVSLWLRDAPPRARPKPKRIVVRPVEVVDAELIDE